MTVRAMLEKKIISGFTAGLFSRNRLFVQVTPTPFTVALTGTRCSPGIFEESTMGVQSFAEHSMRQYTVIKTYNVKVLM